MLPAGRGGRRRAGVDRRPRGRVGLRLADWPRAWSRRSRRSSSRGGRSSPTTRPRGSTSGAASSRTCSSRSLECYAAACLGLGGTELAGAERAARQLVRTAPLRESGCGLLMEALEAQGNVAEALSSTRRCASACATSSACRRPSRCRPCTSVCSLSGANLSPRFRPGCAQPRSRRLGSPDRKEPAMSATTDPCSLRGDADRSGPTPRYDEARALYNAMIDKRPALIARCVDVADVIACVRFAAASGSTSRSAAAATTAAASAASTAALVDRPLAAARRARRPGGPHGDASPAARRSGEVDHAHARVRARGALRDHLDDRRRRADARRRSRPSDAQVRADDRQPDRRRRRPGRRTARAGDARASTRICSGRCAAAAATSASSRRSRSRRGR